MSTSHIHASSESMAIGISVSISLYYMCSLVSKAHAEAVAISCYSHTFLQLYICTKLHAHMCTYVFIYCTRMSVYSQNRLVSIISTCLLLLGGHHVNRCGEPPIHYKYPS